MIRNVVLTRGTRADAERGLLGYLRLDFGLLRLDGLTLRRTSDGRLTLSWPERRDRYGRAHPLVRPLDDRARLDLEAAVLSELRRQGAAK